MTRRVPLRGGRAPLTRRVKGKASGGVRPGGGARTVEHPSLASPSTARSRATTPETLQLQAPKQPKVRPLGLADPAWGLMGDATKVLNVVDPAEQLMVLNRPIGGRRDEERESGMQ